MPRTSSGARPPRHCPDCEYLDVDSTPSSPQLTGPAGYVKGGGTATFHVTGVHAGDQLCLTGGPGGAGGTATGTSWTRSASLFDQTGARAFTVRDRDGHSDSVLVRQLGSKKLQVTRAHFRNKRSKFVTATIYGLAPGERASIYFRGHAEGHRYRRLGRAVPGQLLDRPQAGQGHCGRLRPVR